MQGEAYETESSSSDASTPIKNQVFPEPAFEPPPPNLNFDLSPKPPQSTQTKLLKLTAATSSSSPKRKQSSESSNSDSSSESDYEDPSIVNVRKIARIDLPDLSVIDSEEDFGSNLEVDGSIGGDPSTIKVGNKRRCLLDLSIPTSDDEVNKSCGDPSIIKVRSKLPDVSGYSPITSDEELNKCIGDPSTINVGNKKHCISDLSLIICEEELDKNLGDPSAIEVGKADRQCVGSFLPITSDDPDETSIGDPSTIKVKKAARQFSPISSNEDFETSPELTNSTKENLTLAVTDIVIENEKKQEGDENKKDCEEKSSTSKAHEIVHEELKCIGKDKATIIGNQILSDATTRIESPEKQTESVNTSTTTTEHQMDNDVLVLDVSDVALLDVNSVVVLDDSDSIVIEVSDTSDEDDNLVGVKDISDNLQVANLIHTSVVQSVPKKSKGGSKRKTFVDYWMDDQQKFYFESWGDENFNTADAQKTMSGNK